MSQYQLSTELDRIIEAVRQAPDASLEVIHQRLGPTLTRRSLQRRLATLVQRGQLRRTGTRGGARYHVPDSLTSLPVEASEIYVPITAAGKAIKKYVRQPSIRRRPVGYNRAFLDAYQPDRTFYLPESARAHLRGLGSPAEHERPAGTYAHRILHRLLIDLSWNSSRLEGNTYSLLETERLVAFGEVAQGKDALAAQMILNHKAAIEFLVEEAEAIDFNRHTLLNLHALLADNLLPDPAAGGRLRRLGVGITSSVFHPLEVPQLIDECFEQVLATARAIHDPFEQSFFAMVHLPYLQPFDDVNKRVSRLAANIPLIKQNWWPLSFVDVPDRAYIDGTLGVYELNDVDLLRDVFVWAYERSAARYASVRQSLGEPDPFRLRYRALIIETVAQIVRQGLTAGATDASVQSAMQGVPEPDRAHFSAVVSAELRSLHDGNIARYRLRPSEFAAWEKAQP